MNQVEIMKIMIPYTGEERIARIYLPDSYYQDKDRRYPVLYMHDGQNIFSKDTAFGGGCWEVIQAAKNVVLGNKAREFIIVGIDNEGERRFEDYSPWKNKIGGDFLPVGTRGGDGEQYADFLVKEFLPLINTQYRTLSDTENTALAGSSMGGLITAYIVAKYPDYFAKAGIFSMAGWFAEQELLQYVKQSENRVGTKYFIQVGTMETVTSETETMNQLFIDSTLQYCRALLEKGTPVQNIKLIIGAGDIHSESSWKKYMESFFEYIFPYR